MPHPPSHHLLRRCVGRRASSSMTTTTVAATTPRTKEAATTRGTSLLESSAHPPFLRSARAELSTCLSQVSLLQGSSMLMSPPPPPPPSWRSAPAVSSCSTTTVASTRLGASTPVDDDIRRLPRQQQQMAASPLGLLRRGALPPDCRRTFLLTTDRRHHHPTQPGLLRNHRSTWTPSPNYLPFTLSRSSSSSLSSSSRLMSTMTPVTVFSDEEQLMQEATRTWARSFLLPKVRDMDDAKVMDPDVIKALFEQGFMGLEIPEDMGGSGLNFTTAVLVIEELSRVDPSVSIMVDIHNTLIVNALRRWGSNELQHLWLPRLATDTVSSFCLSEAGSGSDAFSMRTTATHRTDNSHGTRSPSYYVINGEKMWISSAQQAGVFLVFANADITRAYKGITAFVVDAQTEGITVGKPENKLGLKASSTCSVVFDNVVVPESAVLGEVGMGYKYCIEILNEGRIGIAAQQLGIAKGCLDVVLPHLNDRVQFGKSLMDFQAVQHQYAQAAVDTYAAECMIYNACRLKEMGLPIVKEASMCKYYASGVAERVASKSIELLGGIGFTQDLLVEKMYRDCKVGSIYEGTSNIQLQTIAKLVQNEYNRDR